MRRHFYGPTAYITTKLVLDGLLLRLLPAILYVVPFYWLMGLRASAAAFITFIFVYSSFAMLVRGVLMCHAGSWCADVPCWFVVC